MNPCTRATSVPEYDTEKKANEERNKSAPIQGVKKKSDDHQYGGDEKVGVQHHVWMYERASMKVLREGGAGVVGSELGGDLVFEVRTVNARLRDRLFA